jgi:ATP-dependent DNA ligase
MARAPASSRSGAPLPRWVKPQFTQLVREAPEGAGWLHEIKFDGYRMHDSTASSIRRMRVAGREPHLR